MIDTNKIRGRWQELDEKHVAVAGGDDTIKSIKLVADKVNEIVEWINSKKDQLL